MNAPRHAVFAAALCAALAAASSCSRAPAPAPEPSLAELRARAAALRAELSAVEAALAAREAAAPAPAVAAPAPAASEPPAPPAETAPAAYASGASARAAASAGRADPSEAELDAVSRAGSGAATIGRNPYRGAVAVDAATGRILFEDHPDAPCLPASMVKMMDLLLVQEAFERGELRPSDMVGVSTRAYNTGGSQVYLDPKERFTMEDMLYALIIQSANDAAVAIAEHVAGSCEAMVERMNRRAAELGMTATRFRSVHGLPADAKSGAANDVSTPRDMALLALELCRHPDVFKYTSADFRVFRPEPRLFEMRTHNPVLQSGTRIAGADGLKTGYTRRAGYSLAVSVERAGRRVLVVTMGTAVTNPQGELDAKSSKNVRNKTIAALVERAFAEP